MVNWNGEQYPGAKKNLLGDVPAPKGKEVKDTVYVDADHAHDLITHCSVNGLVFFINNTPMKWYTKRQNMVKSSTHVADLVALRIAITCNIIEF